jgi:hypothetical protein
MPHVFANLADAPYTLNNVIDGGQVMGSCDHCSTGIRYAFVYSGSDGRTFKVGSDCALKAEGSTAVDAKAWKAKHNRQLRTARKATARAKRQAQWDKENMRSARAFVRSLGNTAGIALCVALRHDHDISRDLRAGLIRWGKMSPKQVALALKLAAEPTVDEPVFVRLPDTDKRVRVTGKILSAKLVDSMYGQTQKMLVAYSHEGGVSKVWGTMPGDIDEAISKAHRAYVGADTQPTWMDLAIGATVAFDARVTASKDDDTFGFFSRPTKGTVTPGASA